MDAIAHSLAGCLWLFAWLFTALAFIRSKKCKRSLINWMKWTGEKGTEFGGNGSIAGLLLSVAVFAFLGFCVCGFLLFLTPALMVGCLLEILRKGGRG